MPEFAEPIAKLINEFKRLPGIGNKSAQRLAFHMLRASEEEVKRFSSSLLEVKERIKVCSICYNLTELDPCQYCTNLARDQQILCIVEEAYNLLAIERTGEYRGLYHVLQGTLSPIRGIGPENLRIRSLLERLRNLEVKEIILATNPTTEGEATAGYIGRLLKPLEIKITRIAIGLPAGSDLEYADEVTMHKALTYRHEI